MPLQEPGHPHRPLGVGLHAQDQGLHPAQEQEGVEGALGPAQVAEPLGPDLADELGRPHHRAAQDVAVAGEVLGGRVHHQVDAEFERAGERRGGEGVVGDGEDAPLPGEAGDLGEVVDAEGGVRRGLDVDHPGVGAHRLGQRPVGGVDDPDAVALEGVVEEPLGAAVERPQVDELVPRLEQGEDQRGDGGHAAGEGDRVLPALERRQLLLEGPGGGVLDAGVEVALFLAGKEPPPPLEVAVDEGRGLEDRLGQRAGRRVRPLPGVDRQRAEFRHRLTSLHRLSYHRHTFT